MSSNYEIRKVEDEFHVLDEMENIMEIFAVRKDAVEFVKDLEDSDAKSNRIIAEKANPVVEEPVAEVEETQEIRKGEDDPAVHVQEPTQEPTQPQAIVFIPRPATATVKYVATGKTPTKAERIREQIGVAKLNGLNGDVVVNWAIAELGMKKQLARVYVKENWCKVVV